MNQPQEQEQLTPFEQWVTKTVTSLEKALRPLGDWLRSAGFDIPDTRPGPRIARARLLNRPGYRPYRPGQD